MSVILSNPAGLWALLGIPAVLVIHLLQRKAQVVTVATLFLLEKTQRDSVSGRRIERLVNSVPLWMQLLAVLLLTWLLVEPRYPKARALQRIAVVLDASASMEVFRERLAGRLAAELPRLAGPAAEAEYVLLETTPGAGRLYAGGDAAEMLGRLRSWRPRAGLTDPTPALRLARSLVSRDGLVVFATDTPGDALPFDALQLAVGEPVANVGFTGVWVESREGALVWQALVRNYSAAPASRTWVVELPDGTRSEPARLELAPGALARIQAAFPAGAGRLRVVLDGDAFTLDDTLPLVAPQPKPLAIHGAAGPGLDELMKRLAGSLEAVAVVADPAAADLLVVRAEAGAGGLPQANVIAFAGRDGGDAPLVAGAILAEAHPLMDGLNWQPLLVRDGALLSAAPGDQVLLRQGNRPLIVLRETAVGEPPRSLRQLLFQFDLAQSNALRLPALAVLLHRFCGELRAAKVAPARLVLETGEPFAVAADPGGPPLRSRTLGLDGSATATATVPAVARWRSEAPRDPGFMQVTQGDLMLLDAAVHFGDTREADFAGCGSADNLASAAPATTRRHTREDHWWRGWLLALVLALLVGWHYTKAGRRDRAKPEAPAGKSFAPAVGSVGSDRSDRSD